MTAIKPQTTTKRRRRRLWIALVSAMILASVLVAYILGQHRDQRVAELRVLATDRTFCRETPGRSLDSSPDMDAFELLAFREPVNTVKAKVKALFGEPSASADHAGVWTWLCKDDGEVQQLILSVPGRPTVKELPGTTCIATIYYQPNWFDGIAVRVGLTGSPHLSR